MVTIKMPHWEFDRADVEAFAGTTRERSKRGGLARGGPSSEL